MRNSLHIFGTGLLAIGLVGIIGLFGLGWRPDVGGPVFHAPVPAPSATGVTTTLDGASGLGSASTTDDENLVPAGLPVDPLPALGMPPITRVTVASIGLDTPVAPAPYSADDGGTWEIPKFMPGHAEYTAGAGQPGNAVLFGHVVSISSGHIFSELNQAKVGDLVQVYSPDNEFDYRVVEVKSVDRDDVSVLDATQSPSISMITCTGDWLPFAVDYSERLVVRAVLTGAPTA